MNKNSFLNKLRIQGDQILEDAKEYLARMYGNMGGIYTPSDPFGQILTTVANIGMLILTYLEDVATSRNPYTSNKIIDIYGNAQLAGHDPYRGNASKGEIKFRFKPGKETEFEGPYIKIEDKTKLKCLNNMLTYTLRLNDEYIKLQKNDSNFQTGILVQGVYEDQSVQGTGRIMQTFNISTPGLVDNDDISVKVNSKKWKKYDSLYDMVNGEVEGYLVRTGLSGGIDIIFGNGYFGKVPELGSEINVEYLLHNGTAGIIDLSLGDLKFEFAGDGYDFRGNEIDLNEFMINSVTKSPLFGADNENTEFTKFIAPLASKSFTLINPSNYEYFLARYNSLSYIHAYNSVDDEYLDDDNIIYLFLLPDIRRKMTSDFDYFTIGKDEFILNDDENDAIMRLIYESGNQATTSEVEIVKPKIKEYVINIILRYFDNYNKNDIRNEIRTKLGEYFMNNKRRDRIPRSDLIAIIEDIKGVDSVNVFFVSKDNEQAIRDGYYIKRSYNVKPTTPFLEKGEGNRKRFVYFEKQLIETKINLNGVNPNIGLDEFGDIKLNEDEVAIIRGGWLDRNDIYYEEFPTESKPSSLSIYFKEKVEEKLNAKIK